MIHGGAHSSSVAASAASLKSGHASGAGTAYFSMRATRACHCRKSVVQGKAAIPSCRSPSSAAICRASGSAFRISLDCSNNAPKRRCRRAWIICSRSSQAISVCSTICCVKICSISASCNGAARKIRASRSAPSSSAATMNSDFESACGVAKRAPLPFASTYRPPSPRERPIRSG